jgi:hypothetical protein
MSGTLTIFTSTVFETVASTLPVTGSDGFVTTTGLGFSGFPEKAFPQLSKAATAIKAPNDRDITFSLTV